MTKPPRMDQQIERAGIRRPTLILLFLERKIQRQPQTPNQDMIKGQDHLSSNCHAKQSRSAERLQVQHKNLDQASWRTMMKNKRMSYLSPKLKKRNEILNAVAQWIRPSKSSKSNRMYYKPTSTRWRTPQLTAHQELAAELLLQSPSTVLSH